MVALIVLALSVAADATAVAIAASVRGTTLRRGFVMALSFGAAQSIMAAVGWLGGAFIEERFSAWDHWVALALLTIVGVRMIRGEEDREQSAGTLLLLTLATSIDALAVGVTLPALRVAPAIALTTIGVVTFLLSLAGAAFGRFLGQRFGRLIEIAGGLGLIAIGITIVVEHLGD